MNLKFIFYAIAVLFLTQIASGQFIPGIKDTTTDTILTQKILREDVFAIMINEGRKLNLFSKSFLSKLKAYESDTSKEIVEESLFVQSQKAWLEYRNIYSKLSEKLYDPGYSYYWTARWAMTLAPCMTQLTVDRNNEIKYLENILSQIEAEHRPQSPDSSDPPDYIAGVEQPVPTVKIDAEYPADAQDRHIEGVVWVKALLQTDGTIKKAVVVKTDNAIFNAPSIKAMLQWKFTPAILHGKPVNIWVVEPFRFKLN